jgi:cell division protein FtsN
MPAGKDYKRRSSSSKNQGIPGYMWMLAGLAIGLFVAFLVYLDKQPKEKISFTEAVTQELDKVKAQRNNTKVKKTDKNENRKEPEFSFYTILPELEVLINDSEIQSEKKTEKPENIATKPDATRARYILQAGSFRSYDDANTLKASLALLGVESSIQSVNIKNESWHRVRIGPFSQTKTLHGVRNTLKQNNIKTMTMELK